MLNDTIKGYQFILDGANGTGKTTMAKMLDDAGFSTLFSPGATPLGKLIRDAARGAGEWDGLNHFSEFYLFQAAQIDELVSIIRPRIEAGEIVITDRTWTSTFVYQCQLRAENKEESDILTKMLQGFLAIQKDVLKNTGVIIYSGDPEVLCARVETERNMNPAHNKCRYTADRSLCDKINMLYVSVLPRFLTDNNIPFRIIDTTELSTLDQYTATRAAMREMCSMLNSLRD